MMVSWASECIAVKYDRVSTEEVYIIIKNKGTKMVPLKINF